MIFALGLARGGHLQRYRRSQDLLHGMPHRPDAVGGAMDAQRIHGVGNICRRERREARPVFFRKPFHIISPHFHLGTVPLPRRRPGGRPNGGAIPALSPDDPPGNGCPGSPSG